MAAILLEPALRVVIWSAALTWMGAACIANARRCGRTRCRFTGSYLLMAALVVAYAAGTLPIGAATIVGTSVGQRAHLGTILAAPRLAYRCAVRQLG